MSEIKLTKANGVFYLERNLSKHNLSFSMADVQRMQERLLSFGTTGQVYIMGKILSRDTGPSVFLCAFPSKQQTGRCRRRQRGAPFRKRLFEYCIRPRSESQREYRRIVASRAAHIVAKHIFGRRFWPNTDVVPNIGTLEFLEQVRRNIDVGVLFKQLPDTFARGLCREQDYDIRFEFITDFAFNVQPLLDVVGACAMTSFTVSFEPNENRDSLYMYFRLT